MLAGQLALRRHHRLYLHLHALHRPEQLGHLIVARRIDDVVQAATGDAIGQLPRPLQRTGQAAGDRPGRQRPQ
ncbi:hypothetical protein G6F32_016730 [Rhizopus arrhizus]|nr:hypothetical protein G6F32_016730 [Rhizopus arrhizus]